MKSKLFALLLAIAPLAQAQSVIFTPNTQQACTAACVTAFTPPAPTVVLSNVPDGLTPKTNASIGYVATPAGTTVWCRRDQYAPGPCGNPPFVLGAVNPLAAGVHRVDFYALPAGATSVDATKPTATYSWAISATPPPPPASGPPPSGVTPLAALPYPVPTNFSGTGSPSVSATTTLTGSDGAVRLQPIADPGGSGQTVYLHRIFKKDLTSQGSRAEKLWIDQGKNLKPGTDYWLAFAFRAKGDEWPKPTGLGDDAFAPFQTHSESNGDTQPPVMLNVNMAASRYEWRTSYSAAAQATGPQGTKIEYASTGPMQTDVWYRYVIHLRPGYLPSQLPKTEVWQAIGTGAYAQIVNSTLPNDYNWSSGSYARIGFYKWSSTGWSSSYPTIAGYFSTLYMGQGVNLYDAAVASVSALK